MKYGIILFSTIASIGLVVVWGCGNSDTAESKKENTSTHMMHNHSDSQAHTMQKATDDKPISQTTCPVMGNPINKDLFVDYHSKRIYVCCQMCVKEVKKNPEKYLKKLDELGQKPEEL